MPPFRAGNALIPATHHSTAAILLHWTMALARRGSEPMA